MIKIHNQELALAFELDAAGVQLTYIAEGLGCTEQGLRRAMNRARERGMWCRRKTPRARHTRAVNEIARERMRDR